MEVIITGASGFVGVNLKKYLQDIHTLNSLTVRYKPNQKFDLKGNAIIHLASKVHDLKKVSNHLEYYDANYELTKQLFDSFLESNVSVFIFMSTVKSVADVVQDVLVEDVIPDPQTHYGMAKQLAEQHILSQKIPTGKRVYILRPCMIHGPENKGNLNLLYQLVSKGLPWPLGDFKNQRSFLSIENLCFIINELLERPEIASGVYNVADDDPLSTNELIELLGQSLGKPNRILNIRSSWIRIIAKAGDILNLPINSERLKKLTENYVVSNTKINNAIGKKFPVSTRDGLIATFNSF